MKLIVIAPNGKMGKLNVEVALSDDRIELVGAVGPAGRGYIGQDAGIVAGLGVKTGVNVTDDLEEIIDDCDAIVDFSTVEASMDVLRSARKHGKALMCGTTGFSDEQKHEFADAAADIPVMLAANTSKMVNVLYKAVELAAKAVGNETDIEILDMHDANKLDAPSGTAVEIGGIIGKATGKDVFADAQYGRQGRCPRKEGCIGFHSIRGGDIQSNHTVYMIGQGERLEFSHVTGNWKCFAEGACDAAVWLCEQKPGSYTMAQFLGL